MTEWKEYKLGELVKIIGGGTPKTSIPEYWDGDIPWLSVTDFNNGRKYCFDAEKKITHRGLLESSTKILKKGNIIISARGTVGVISMLGRDMAFNQSNYGIESIQDLIDNDYLYYLLKTKVSEFLSNAYGAVFDTITKETFDLIKTNIPTLVTEQQAIASVLSSLDNKIDLLHRQNQTLEAMAETLFRQWFIEEAEESWEETKLSEFMDIKHGYAFKGTFITPEETDKILVTPGNFRVGGGFSFHKFKYYSDSAFPESYILNEGDFIVTMTDLSVSNDSLGYPAFVPHIDGKLLLHNQRVGKVILKQGHYNKKMFLYYLMKTSNYRHYILGSCTGTNVSHTSPTIICDYEFTMPDNEKIRSFDIQVSNLYKKEQQNINQIQTLTQLRDTLLPKLMSGEVRVEM